MVEAGLKLYWREEATRLGWTVTCPIAPKGQRLLGDNLPSVFELIGQIEERFAVELDLDRLERLRSLPIAMYVGGDDAGWVAPMESMRARLESLGSPPARFTVFEGEGHTPKSLSGKTLFHKLESFRVHSALHDPTTRPPRRMERGASRTSRTALSTWERMLRSAGPSRP